MAPIEHTKRLLELDEHVWTTIQRYAGTVRNPHRDTVQHLQDSSKSIVGYIAEHSEILKHDTAGKGPSKHRFIKRTDNDVLQLAKDIAASPGSIHRPSNFGWGTTFSVNELDLIRDLVTQDAVLEFLKERTGYFQSIVDDANYDFKPHGAKVIVTHASSGAKATFTPNPTTGIGTVDSKPGVPSELRGLGIGFNLYLTAARRFTTPNRWSSSATGSFGGGLRRKLHKYDPYTWGNGCSWCDDQEIDWRSANDDAAFADHPTL